MCLSVEVCCFCANLEVGTKIVAVLNLVLSTLIALVYGTATVTLSYLPPSRQMFYALVSVAAVSQLVLTCVMTYGAFRRKPKLLWPWEVMAWVLSVILVAMAILGAAVVTLTIDQGTASEISIMISVYFIYAVILYYSACVVDSRRLEMVQSEQSEANVQLMKQRHVPKSLLDYEDVV
ncbi:unnamed protein product [Parnassius mnemosyne]|uniref:MARVEL domain-containing protein n=1 Tax=Parnassius mnemosyne TaxID=213953 RepID=A0AAV1KKN7_9NEOP